MGYKTLCLGFFCILFAYCIYSPVPENIEEPWKVRTISAIIKITSFLVIYFLLGNGMQCYILSYFYFNMFERDLIFL